MLLALILVPILLGGVAFIMPFERVRPWLLPVGGATHLGLTATAIARGASPMFDRYLVLDPLGTLVLGFTSVLFFLCFLYAPGYLRQRPERRNRVFVACLLVFVGTTSLILLTHHLGLMWVALEATTLCTAPLLYFNHNARSLEAVWKYLLVGSVGIALALLGSLFLAYSALHARLTPSLLLEDLIRDGHALSRPWLHAAFVLLFVGYGTKMGLAPMHTWKPDAYGEAPGLVGALLAGGLTNCAFLAILRFFHILSAAGEAAFARELKKAKDRQKGTVGEPSREQRTDQSRRFAVRVRLPGVHRRKSHLGAIADEEQHEGRVEPRPRERMSIADQIFEQQRGSQARVQGGVCEEQRSQQRQGDPDRAHEEVLPHCFEGSGIVVEVQQRRGAERGGLKRHPHQAQMVREQDQAGRPYEHQKAGDENAVTPFGTLPKVARSIEEAEKKQDAGKAETQRSQWVQHQVSIEHR